MGPTTTKRSSSLDSFIGRSASDTASRQVRPIIITRNGDVGAGGRAVAVGLDGQVAQARRQSDHAEQRDGAAQRRAQQHQQHDPADGVGADPLRGEGKAEQHAHR